MGPIKSIPCIKRHDSIANDESFIENGNIIEKGNENYRTSYMLLTPTLEVLKNDLSALSPFFEEFEIEVVSCPCLTREPYNLAADGLSGNTGILEVGGFHNFYPRPQTDIVYDIKDILSKYDHDAFVIGSSFVAKPAMPYNGQLTMNAVVSTNPTNIINNSCIASKNSRIDLAQLDGFNDQIKCSLIGQFFFSEGKRGPVIKMRAKGRRSRSNITALIQAALTNHYRYQQLIGLGVVILINEGQTDQRLVSDDFLSYDYNEVQDYYDRLNKYSDNCTNLIILGAILGERLIIFEDNGKVLMRDDCSMFNAVYNDDSSGQFFNDLTPKETEYIVYINIAQQRCYQY